MRALVRALGAVAVLLVAVLVGATSGAPPARADSTASLDTSRSAGPSASGFRAYFERPRVVFDPAHGHVLLVGAPTTADDVDAHMGLAVLAEDGSLVARLLPDRWVRGVAVAPDARTFAVTADGGVETFDATTLTHLRDYPLPVGLSAGDVAVGGGRLWVASAGPYPYRTLGSIDLLTGAFRYELTGLAGVLAEPSLATSAAAPDLLVVGRFTDTNQVATFDIGGGGFRLVATASGMPHTMQITADGRHLLLAEGGTVVRQLGLPLLLPEADQAIGATTSLFALSPDGTRIASVDAGNGWWDKQLLVTVRGAAGPEQEIPTGDYLQGVAVGWSSDGRPLALYLRNDGSYLLARYGQPERPASQLRTLGWPARSTVLGGSIPVIVDVVSLAGGVPGTGLVHVRRDGPDGTARFDMPISAAGQAHRDDVPPLPGTYRYQLTWDGDATMGPASAVLTAAVRAPVRDVDLTPQGVQQGSGLTYDPLLQRLLFLSADRVASVDPAGAGVLRSPPLNGPTSFVLSPDGSKVYVVEPCSDVLTVLDALTLLPVSTVRMTGVQHPDSLAFVGPELWTGFRGYENDTCQRPYGTPLLASGIARLALDGVGDPVVFHPAVRTGVTVSGNPLVPGLLAVAEYSHGLQSFDVSTGEPKLVASLYPGPPYGVSVTDDGLLLVPGGALLRPNLTTVASYGGGLAVQDPASRRIAVTGADSDGWSVVTVRDPDGSSLTSDPTYPEQKVKGVGLAFGPGGATLYELYVPGGAGPRLGLRIIGVLDPTSLQMGGPPLGFPEHPLVLSGRLLASEPVPAGTVTVVRSDGGGSQVSLPGVPVAADGTFTVADTPTSPGPWTYRVAYAGDATHAASGASVVVAGSPTAPQQVAATAAASGASLTWQAPASDGGSPVTGYLVGADGQQPALLPPAVTRGTFAGWSPGSSHRITVSAENAAGPGPSVTVGVVLPAAPSPIDVKYASLKNAAAVLGRPLGPVYDVPGGLARTYQLGRIYSSPATGTHEVHGAILAAYLRPGVMALVGLPTSDETATADRIGRVNAFAHGAIYWSLTTGAHPVSGAVRAAWVSLGSERGWLGYPVKDGYGVPGGYRQDFQHGHVLVSTATGRATASR